MVILDSSTLYIIEGIGVTLKYTLLAAVFGAVIGIILALFRISHNKILKGFAVIYVSIFRGTPLLVQLSIIYFVLPVWGYKISIFSKSQRIRIFR